MSWSVSTGKVNIEFAETYIDGLLDIAKSTIQMTPKIEEQIIAAQQAAKILVRTIESSALNFVIVSLGGHARTGQEGVWEDWKSGDIISIGITQYIDAR